MNPEQLELNAQIEERHWWFTGRRQIMQRLVERLVPPSPESLVIDVGCGTGGNIAALARRYRAVGVDTSQSAIRWGRQRYPQVQFIEGPTPQALGNLVRQARLFLLMDVLEHVADDFRLLSELLALASPGTIFLITVPANPGMWTAHDESHLHYRRYDPTRLRRVWEGLPVELLMSSYFNRRLLPVVQGIRRVNQWRGRASGEAGTDLWIPARPVNALLHRTFAGESRRLLALIDGRAHPYRAGVSLIAALRRKPGEIAVRTKPADVTPDRFDPAARRTEPASL